MMDSKQHPASFRDPAGFIFEHQGKHYRQVNHAGAADYELFSTSGLYGQLVKEKKILSHTELSSNLTGSLAWYKTLLPQQLGFISYPYEWCFSQWKDAAMLTLQVLQQAIARGLILKDATPFNIQFIDGAPVFIDTLSFEKYEPSQPWVAYRQFVECFLGPLLLAKYRHPDLLKMFLAWPSGIPLSMVAKLLPFKSIFNAGVFLHIILPGMVAAKKAGAPQQQAAFSKQKLTNIISNLLSLVQSLSLPALTTQWNDYYQETILSKEYAAAKMEIVKKWLGQEAGSTVLDIGTNTGFFAKAAAAAGKFTIATDADTACIDKLYTESRKNNSLQLMPLCIDITHPPPAIGWENAERSSFLQRAKADITMALAVVHHLAIGKNISFEQMADLFSQLSTTLIIEFVPKTDPKVQLLLRDRKDLFAHYQEENFRDEFARKFLIVDQQRIMGTERILLLMKRLPETTAL